MYCGVIGSSTSPPHGRPSSLISSSKRRAVCSPVAMSHEPSRCGSLIRPFQPTVVRGFSKYVRMTTIRRSRLAAATFTSRCAYSSAASGSWIEHGPTTTSSRSRSRPCRTSRIARRVSRTSSAARGVSGWAAFTARGEISGMMPSTFRSSIFSVITCSSIERCAPKKKAPRLLSGPSESAEWTLVLAVHAAACPEVGQVKYAK